MTFDEAEKKFRELQARVQRGEPISRADYEEQVAQLAVQDERGVLWEINPRTGKWMYFDGAEWVVGRPPGRDQSTVMPISQLTQAAPPTPTPTPQRPPTPAAPTLGAPTPSARPAKPPAAPPPTKPLAPSPPRPAVPAPPSPRSAAPTLPSSRPAAPTTGAPPSKVAPSPETIQPWTQKKAPTAGAKAPGAGQKPARVITPLAGANREWVPLAIGAVVLLFCAIVLFLGAQFLFGSSSGRPTSTRVAVRSTNTPEATVVRLPTATPPPPTPAPVLAKIIERTANVRAGPGKTFRVISTLKKDNQITLIGRNEAADWFQVNVAGATQTGWISREVLEITSGDPNSLPVGGTSTATPTKKPAAPVGPQATPSLTPIGGPTPTPSS